MNHSVRANFFATSSGGITLDRDQAGGNPFATALIELSHEPSLRLCELPTQLKELTIQKSNGRQSPDCRVPTDLPDWTFQRVLTERTEVRQALVLVVSDYSASPPRSSLEGAARDERRISATLALHGFSVTQGVAPQRSAILHALTSFKRRSSKSDVAIVYSTGHGLEVDGEVFLLPGDYPAGKIHNEKQLRRSAIRISDIALAAQARWLNLIFFAGCRKQPRTESLSANLPH